MNRKARLLCLIGSVGLLSACSLRAPSYNPDLGGFPIYKGGHGDRARLYQGVELNESKTPKKEDRARTALLLAH